MCTLSYIPTKEGFIVTANRDESPLRRAETLSEYRTAKGETFLIAKEPVHGGTNFAASTEGAKIVVLLNGGFKAHSMGGKYRLSRGLVVLESLEYADLAKFASEFDFEGVEPFTMVHFDSVPKEMRWDGTDAYIRTLPADRPMIVASALMYPPFQQMRRRVWFANELRAGSPTHKSLFHFHLTGGDGNPESDMVMVREFVRTVSISQVTTTAKLRRIRHLNKIEGDDRSWEFRR